MNSFDWLRLLAAGMVIYHHLFPLSGRPPAAFFATDYGALGVGVFFVISGYLVSGSLQRSAGVGDYLKKRLLRIEPGLIVSLLVTALVLGAIATTLPLGAYFASPQVWLYVARNALLYPVDYALPGVFDANPYAGVVNGSLWTLRLEFSCYLVLALLALAKVFNARALAIVAAVAAALFIGLHLAWPRDDGPLRLVHLGAMYVYLFAAGAWFWLSGKTPPLAAVLACTALLATPLWVLGLPVVVLGLGRLPAPKLPADLSYGLYIYAFPIQQILAAHGVLSLWASLALTLPFAAASWFLVEKPALRFKPSNRHPRARPEGP